MASLVVEHRFWGLGALVVACEPSSCGSRALDTGSAVGAHGLSCSAARGIFLDKGLNLCLLHRPEDSLPLSQERCLGKLYSLKTCKFVTS